MCCGGGWSSFGLPLAGAQQSRSFFGALVSHIPRARCGPQTGLWEVRRCADCRQAGSNPFYPPRGPLAQTAQMRARRESFLDELLADLTVYPYTKETAMLAGKIEGEQQSQGVVIPFGDLLVGATAVSLGFSMLTANLRDFQEIPC